jgi:zinc and cadmium transporter
MASYWQVIIFSLLGSVVSLAGGILLLSKKSTAKALADYATPFAAGALLAAVFFDLLPEGIAESDVETVLFFTLMGLLVFFILERFLRWFHHHHEHSDHQDSATNSLIIIGDTLHNALDGVVIAAAFLINVPTGIITTIAVAAHEIPQEIGDFGLLLAHKMSRKKVLIVNITSALATVLAAIITFSLGSAERLPLGALFGLSAGLLLYIATSDIIPSIHQKTQNRGIFDVRPILLILGVVVVYIFILIAENYKT